MLHLRDITYSLLILLLILGLHYGIDSIIYSGLWNLKYDYVSILIISGRLRYSLRSLQANPFFSNGHMLSIFTNTCYKHVQ